MIITIDGPAGTGKSSVAHAVAERLGYDFLDTGAMYRAIGLEALRRRADLADGRELAYLAKHARVEFDWSKHPPGVLLNGEPVGHLLRGGEATKAASHVAVVPAIREVLVAEQQRIGRQRPNLVTEGRDQGTVVFPDAELKDTHVETIPENQVPADVMKSFRNLAAHATITRIERRQYLGGKPYYRFHYALESARGAEQIIDIDPVPTGA